MKNTKLTKILTAVMALILLIGAITCIATSAEDADTLAIVAKNVSHGDRIQIALAVAAPEGSEVEVVYYFEDPELNPEATAFTAVKSEGKTFNYNGKDCPVFYTEGIPAKDLANQIYAKAHIIGTDTWTDYTVYSVAEFIYARLYKHNVIAATEGDALTEKNLYLSLIEYASYAQMMLEENDETLLRDYYYAYVQDGTLDGAEDSAIFDPENASVTLAYTGNASDFNGWNVTTYNAGTSTTVKVSANATVALTGHTVITPAYLAPLTAGETFDKLTTLKGDGTDSKIKFGKTTCATSDLGLVQSGDEIAIVKDPTGGDNNVLKFTDGSTGSGVYSTVWVGVSGSQVTNGLSVFETRIYIPSADVLSNGGTIAQLAFTAGRTAQGDINLSMYSDASQAYFTLSNTDGKETGRAVYTDGWHILRLEFYNSTTAADNHVKVYIDNLYAGKIDYATANDVNGFFWKSYNSAKTTVYFDNMSLTEKALPTD